MTNITNTTIYVRRNRHYYNTDDDKHTAIKQLKREWYQRNKERQQVMSLIYYYEKLIKQEQNPQKIEMINNKLTKLREKAKELPTVRVLSRSTMSKLPPDA